MFPPLPILKGPLPLPVSTLTVPLISETLVLLDFKALSNSSKLLSTQALTRHSHEKAQPHRRHEQLIRYLHRRDHPGLLLHLDDDPFTRKSFYLIECLHRKSLKPLRSELIHRFLHRYPSISHLDLSCCPRVNDPFLASLSASWKSTLLSINFSRSRHFTATGLRRSVENCSFLVEIDLLNDTELTDAVAEVVAKAKNLERLMMARCKLITDIGIGCVAVGCRKLRLLCLRWCIRVTDLGAGFIAMKCKELRSLDLSCLPKLLNW